MKKITSYFLLILLSSQILNARIGCLHNSYEGERKYDHKEYHPVACNCPCEKEYKIHADGTCSKCGHRHSYIFIQQQHTSPTKSINVARLKKYSEQKNQKKSKTPSSAT